MVIFLAHLGNHLIMRSIQPVQLLYVVGLRQGYRQGIYGVVAVVNTLAPILDTLLLPSALRAHYRGHLCCLVAREIQGMQYLVVAPCMAQKVRNAAARGAHKTNALLQYLHRLAGDILALPQLAVDEIRRNILRPP